MLGHMFVVAKQIAADQGISASGYRLIVNCGADANQEVMHLHMHIVGGRDLGPMLPGHD
jgi:histidine triad (HIT) family protein